MRRHVRTRTQQVHFELCSRTDGEARCDASPTIRCLGSFAGKNCGTRIPKASAAASSEDKEITTGTCCFMIAVSAIRNAATANAKLEISMSTRKEERDEKAGNSK